MDNEVLTVRRDYHLPPGVGRGDEGAGRVVQLADQAAESVQLVVGQRRRRVRSLPGHVLKDMPATLVEAEGLWRCREAGGKQMLQQRFDRWSRRRRGLAHRDPHANHDVGDVAPVQHLL